MEIKLSQGALTALERLTNAGHRAYIVGGSVRDAMMGKAPSDFDITTSALPDETKSLFEEYTVFESGKAHGTVAVVIDREVLEITTFRYDGEYADHRHPTLVSFTRSLEDDLARRDFTVNAMAYNPNSGVVDIFGGKEDLNCKIIRCVGDARTRFEEDALRILRALRFASVLDFQIHEDTALAIREKRELLTFVSRERVYAELKKLVSGVNAGDVISEYAEIFHTLFGEFEIDTAALSKVEGDMARLAVFFFNAPEKFATLKPSKKDNSSIASIVKLAKMPLDGDANKLKRLISSFGAENLRISLEVKRAMGENVLNVERVLSAILASELCVSVSDLNISGADIIKLGVPPSERMGKILQTLFDEVLDGKLENKKEKLLKRACEIIN